MKLLLDENLPIELRKEIPGHDCETVAYRDWRAIRNGELMRKAADAGFDALVTKDTNLPYQQDRSNLPIAVVVLVAESNDLDDILPLIPALLTALETLRPKAITLVG